MSVDGINYRRSWIVAWVVARERSQAAFYFSDLYAAYRGVIYRPGIHTPMPDNSETYRVEGMNAELRHSLARLVRKSRCFSGRIEALQRAVKLFAVAWNRRQLYRLRFPVIRLISSSLYALDLPHSYFRRILAIHFKLGV